MRSLLLATAILALAAPASAWRIPTASSRSPASYVLGFKLSGAEASKLGFSNPAGVPEPASWATMIAGFLLAGNAIRRRRRALPHATA